MQRKSLWKLSAALALPFLAFTASSQALTTIYDSTGFETPNYTAGNLVGQDGWGNFSDTTASATVTAGGTTPTTPSAVTINSTTVGANNFGGFYRFLNFTPVSGATLVSVKFDVNAPTYANTPNANTRVGIELANTGGQVLAAAYTGTAGGIAKVYDASGVTNANSGVTAGAYGSYEIIMDYLTTTYSIKVNGSTLLNGVFFGPGTDLSYIAFADYNGNGENVLFDNLNVTATPEPASLSVLGLAGLGLMARRRRA